MNDIVLKVGLSATDRTRPLADGEVAIEGFRADISLLGVQELFNKQLSEHTFDCCEFPLATYIRTLEQPGRPYAAIPVFPSRHFRFSSVFVNSSLVARYIS
jgi:4,5-dihydroxyphthalate decarboxylase